MQPLSFKKIKDRLTLVLRNSQIKKRVRALDLDAQVADDTDAVEVSDKVDSQTTAPNRRRESQFPAETAVSNSVEDENAEKEDVYSKPVVKDVSVSPKRQSLQEKPIPQITASENVEAKKDQSATSKSLKNKAASAVVKNHVQKFEEQSKTDTAVPMPISRKQSAPVKTQIQLLEGRGNEMTK
jgi:hypothetical protein